MALLAFGAPAVVYHFRTRRGDCSGNTGHLCLVHASGLRARTCTQNRQIRDLAHAQMSNEDI